MGGYENLEAYLEHVSLVMDLTADRRRQRSMMTRTRPRGWSSRWSSCPAGRRRLPLPAQAWTRREKGLEEERRLAYVGITRAREEARISFAANRQVYGRWTSQLPSRFVDEAAGGQRRGLLRDRLLRRRSRHAAARQPLG
jgi:DNA helicase-2/ATP-dependent DNA helicase PcrA